MKGGNSCVSWKNPFTPVIKVAPSLCVILLSELDDPESKYIDIAVSGLKLLTTSEIFWIQVELESDDFSPLKSVQSAIKNVRNRGISNFGLFS